MNQPPFEDVTLSPESETGAGLHHRLLDTLGEAVCSGRLRSGTVVTVEEIVAGYGVSRSVVREAVRVLESMHLVRSRRRIGIVVLPSDDWNLYDPQLIRWQLASSARLVQLQELTELRAAVEPEAARLAAVRASRVEASALVGLAGRLWAVGQEHDDDAFVEIDVQFHGLVLKSSGNRMFAKLDALVGEVLRGRTTYGYTPPHPHREALQHHLDAASAIQRGDPTGARDAMSEVMRRALDELTYGWDDDSGA